MTDTIPARIVKLFQKKRHPVAIVIHDGREWHVYLFTPEGNAWKPGATGMFAGQNPYHLPEKVTAFARDHGARRIRILIPGDVYTIGIELPDDHEPEEAHTALAYELEGETELEAHDMRLAAVRADRFRMGGTPNTVLATPFEGMRINAFDDACRSGGVDFEGVGSLELALLNYHARTHAQARCLLLRQQNCLYATPATAVMSFSVQSLSVSFSPEDAGAHPDRYERIARRLTAQADLPVVVCSHGPPEAERLETLRATLGAQAGMTVVDIHDCAPDMARHAACAREVGTLSNGCALIGKNRTPVDPHRVGTWLFCFIVVLCVATLGMRYLDLRWELHAAGTRTIAWEQIEKERSRLSARYESLKQQRDQCQSIARMLTTGRPLPNGLLELLDVLGREIPHYTRVRRLSENENGVLVLEGSTFYQQAVDQLTRSMCRVLQPLGLHVDPVGIEGNDTDGELRFTYWFVSAQQGGGR